MKYGIGDKVKVVNYGALLWDNLDGKTKVRDIRPEIVGKEGIISKAEIFQDRPQYAIDGIPKKHAWYDEEQLEMINQNPNTIN